MHLISVITPNYVPKALPFLQSLSVVKSVPVHVVLLDFNDQTDPTRLGSMLEIDFPDIDFRKMDLPPTASFGMVQDSVWSVFDDLPDDEVACLCDADIVVGRDFESAELAEFNGVATYNTLWAAYNCGEGDSLWLEAHRLWVDEGWLWEHRPVGGWSSLKCFNCGVLVGRLSTFRAVQAEYAALYPAYSQATEHRSRCQFLLNYCWHRLRVTVKAMSPALHCHGHWTHNGQIVVPAGTTVEGGGLKYNGLPVMFAHNFPDLKGTT